jgi:hypothetical protein
VDTAIDAEIAARATTPEETRSHER